MADTPAADIDVDEATVRRLLRGHPDAVRSGLPDLPLAPGLEGWDCSMWRLGDDLAVRLPRRAAAAQLIRHEQQVLPAVAERLAPTGVQVPSPLVHGAPTPAFPHPWSVVPWIRGGSGIAVPRAHRDAWAVPLAAALTALHVPARGDFPVNPFRGVPLAARDDVVGGRLARAAASGRLSRAQAAALSGAWRHGLREPAWPGAPVWIHGDVHPANLVAEQGALRGLIDFGDVTAGDPAYDVAAAWIVFGPRGRAAFLDAMAADAATRIRARAWAAAVAVLLAERSDDDPAFAALAREIVTEVRE